MRNLISESQITITIKGKGEQNILSDEIANFDDKNCKFGSLPIKILINNH